MDTEASALERAIAEGWISRVDAAPIAPVEPAISDRRIADVLAEDRGE